MRIEFLQVVVERIPVHQVGRVRRGQHVDVLAQALPGAGGVPPGFVVELPSRARPRTKRLIADQMHKTET